MMQHNTTTTVSSPAKRGIVSLQGPRPLPLSLPTTSPPRSSKRPRVVVVNGGGDDDNVRAPQAAPGPVILYEHTPRVIHARPDEFKALVQRLTGRPQPTAGRGDQDHHQEAVLRPAVPPPPSQSQQDPLVLTLGQQQVPLPPPVLPSPAGGAAGGGFLLSPGSFLFSPATMQAIQELIS